MHPASHAAAAAIFATTSSTPIFHGSGVLSKHPNIAGTGSSTVPIYHGSGVLTATSPVITQGRGISHIPVYSGVGSLSKIITFAGSGIHHVPVFSGGGALTKRGTTITGAGTASPPHYRVTSNITINNTSITGTGSSTVPVYHGVDNSPTISHPILLPPALAVFNMPVYHGVGNMTKRVALIPNNVWVGYGVLYKGATLENGVGVYHNVTYHGQGTITCHHPTLIGSGIIITDTNHIPITFSSLINIGVTTVSQLSSPITFIS